MVVTLAPYLLALCVAFQTEREAIGNDFAVLSVLSNCCHEVTPFLLAYRQKSGAFERFVRFFVRFSLFGAGLRETHK